MAGMGGKLPLGIGGYEQGMHELTARQWHDFFMTCARVLGSGDAVGSWCAFTTFDRLAVDAGYWTASLPSEADLDATHVKDGGTWGQPFAFDALAHVIVPKTFMPDRYEDGAWKDCISKPQDIEELSNALTARRIPHRLTDRVLEIKCY